MSNDPVAAQREARRRQAAEERVIMQASLQAKRAGKGLKPKGTGGSEAVTAVLVVAVVIGMVVLAVRYGN